MPSRSPPLGALLLAILAACHAAPLRIDEVALSGRTTSPRHDYWSASSPATAELQPGMSVAIVEFCVEFVTDKVKVPFVRQPVARPDEMLPLGSLMQLVGLGSERTSVDPQTLGRVTEDLYASFADLLRARGLAVLDRHQVVSAPAYASLRRHSDTDVDGSLLWHADTGRAEDVALRAMPPLAAIAEFEEVGLERVQRTILEQTGADAALRVRWRVGVEDGYPSFETGSLWSAVGRDGTSTRLHSRRALLASRPAVVDERFALFEGQVATLDAARLRDGLCEVLAPYVDLAFSAMRAAR